MCVIRWASGACDFPWKMGDVMELAKNLSVFFHHISRIGNVFSR